MTTIIHVFSFLIYAFVLVPLLKEVCTFALFFLIIKLTRKYSWPLSLTLAIKYGSIFLAVLFVILNFENHNRFLLVPFFYLIMALIAHYCLKNSFLQKISIIIALMIYSGLEWQFTKVSDKVVAMADWRIGEKIKLENGHDGQTMVELLYGCSIQTIVSDKLAAHLEKKNTINVEVIIRPMYHYGKSVGYEIESIDGQNFESSSNMSGGSSDCENSSTTKTFFPDYFLGMRGL